MLAKYFSAVHWGENLAGQELVPDGKNTWAFIQRLCADNYSSWDRNPYNEYLPQRAAVQGDGGGFKAQDIHEYVEKVFGITTSYTEEAYYNAETGNYMFWGGQVESADQCEIHKVTKKADVYTVTGNIVFRANDDIESAESVTIAAFDFAMELTKNENSPFGFTLQRIRYM